jgi:hypothetical protein
MLKMQTYTKSLAWKDVSITCMKKFFFYNNHFYGPCQKTKTRDYWSICKLNETQMFCKLMNRNRFEQIWNFFHYSGNCTLDDEAGRLHKSWSVFDNLVEKFRKHYKPPQELYLDEEMIPW